MLSTWSADETARSTAQAGGNDVRMQFSSLDDLHGLIRHARPAMGWEGVQLSRDPIQGSVVSRSGRKSRQTSTMVSGSFALDGPTAGANAVIVVAVDFAQSGLFWRSETGTGSIAVIQPGQEIQTLCRSNSSYLTVDIDRQTLEEEMLRNDITPHAGLLDATGVLAGGMIPSSGAAIRSRSAARFSSKRDIAGSMRLAIHPASFNPRAAIAWRVSSAWLMQPSRMPTTRMTGNPIVSARSAVSP